MDLLILLLLPVAFYVFFIRPAQRRQRAAQALRASVRPGQEVITTAGIIGTVVSVADGADEVVLSLSPGVEMRLVKAAIGQVRTPVAEQADEGTDAGREVDRPDGPPRQD